MSDNVTTQATAPATVPSGTGIAARSVTYSGDAAQLVAPVGIVLFAGSDDAKTATDVSNSNPFPISDAGGSITVDGAVTANAGTNLNTSALALETGGNLAAIKADTDKIPSLGQALAASSVPVVLTAIQQTALTPPAAITGFALEAGHLATIDTSTAKIPSQGQALAAASMPVVLTAIQVTALTPPTSVTATPPTASTATLANVAGSASSVTLLASNASRKGAVVYNDSTANLFLKYGSTASATSFTYFLGPGQTWEMPPAILYTGIITGIWASAAGSARVTEL